mmetsp:Transcript_41236/g.106692  ORF Transcript_41236/g.106692 Transcript_41236/m.106692 type:complete len:422 (+) Transcript_41236:749-2014(+)
MEGHAPDVLGCTRICVDGLCPREHFVTVVVPDEQFQVHTAVLQCGAQVVAHEVPLLHRSVDAVLPSCHSHRFVLDRQPPQWQARILHELRKPHVIAGPHIAALRSQFAPVQHRLVVFHPSRRAPRTGDQLQISGQPPGSPEEWQNRALIALEAHRSQHLVVLRPATGPVAGGEVARVYVYSPHFVVQAFLAVKAGIDNALLGLLGHLHQQITRCLGEGPSEAQECLVAHRRLDDYRGVSIVAPGLQMQLRQRAQPLARAVGRAHHRHLAQSRPPERHQGSQPLRPALGHDAPGRRRAALHRHRCRLVRRQRGRRLGRSECSLRPAILLNVAGDMLPDFLVRLLTGVVAGKRHPEKMVEHDPVGHDLLFKDKMRRVKCLHHVLHPLGPGVKSVHGQDEPLHLQRQHLALAQELPGVLAQGPF